MDDLEHVQRRLAAIEQRLTMSAAPPMDRLSGLDLRLDGMQTLLQSIALSQNQHSRQIAEIQTTLGEQGRRLEEQGRRLAELNAGQVTIIEMLTTLIERGDTDS